MLGECFGSTSGPLGNTGISPYAKGTSSWPFKPTRINQTKHYVIKISHKKCIHPSKLKVTEGNIVMIMKLLGTILKLFWFNFRNIYIVAEIYKYTKITELEFGSF